MDIVINLSSDAVVAIVCCLTGILVGIIMMGGALLHKVIQ